MSMKHVPRAFALVSTISLVLYSLVSCTARRQLDTGTVSVIQCEYTFLNTERQDADRIAKVIERYRMEDFGFFISVGNDSIYCEFMAAGLADIDAMHRELRHLPRLRRNPHTGANAQSAGESLIFAETEPVMKLTYRTARLEAGLQMLLKFRISPGARLFYAAEGEYEQEVPEIFVGRDGMVSLPVTAREGRKFIYGRTVLGQVVKCIKVNIYTGESEDISFEEYGLHVRVPPGSRGY